jgi:phage terminase Nu1 subunit (DNA packaging protein)
VTIHSLSQKEAAALLSVTGRSIRDWAEEGIPRNPDGTYPGPAMVAWYVNRQGGPDLDYTVERARLAKAQADKTEIENAVRCGELSITSRIVEWYGGMVADAKNRFLQIPDAIGQQLDPETARRVVAHARRLIHEALAELTRGEPPADGPDSGGLEPAAGPDGEPVGGSVPETVKRGKRGARHLAN